jgi:hypothetical protein
MLPTLPKLVYARIGDVWADSRAYVPGSLKV